MIVLPLRSGIAVPCSRRLAGAFGGPGLEHRCSATTRSLAPLMDIASVRNKAREARGGTVLIREALCATGVGDQSGLRTVPRRPESGSGDAGDALRELDACGLQIVREGGRRRIG